MECFPYVTVLKRGREKLDCLKLSAISCVEDRSRTSLGLKPFFALYIKMQTSCKHIKREVTFWWEKLYKFECLNLKLFSSGCEF